MKSRHLPLKEAYGAGYTPGRPGRRTVGLVFGHLLLGLISLAAGVIALVWPAPTALVLVLVIGIWAAAGGVAEIINGFRTGETAGARPLYILTGLVTVAFGAVLFTRPGIGAITLALLFGLLSLIYGLSRITLGMQWHQAIRQQAPGTLPARDLPPATLET